MHMAPTQEMTANSALHLYERKGYVVQPKTCCEARIVGCIIWLLMGCRYCGSVFMVKPLGSPQQLPMT